MERELSLQSIKLSGNENGLLIDPHSAKGRLLATAATLFNQKGYERTTVRDLASAVGIQSGSIFHHFKTKEAILKAVMEETIIFNTQLMKAKLEKAASPKEKLLALIVCELESINGVTGDAMAVLVYEWRSLNEHNQADILKLRDEYESLWMSVLTLAKNEGLIEGDVFILRRFLTGALSWSKTWFNNTGKVSLEVLAEEALRLAIKL
ncbi:MAG: AcrR family transcriptional regulator [Pseudohongiellaceae bacterium]